MEIKKESIIYPLPSDSLILKKEEFWRVQLPVDYKNFIKVNNGGSPEKNLLCVITIAMQLLGFYVFLNPQKILK
ncbi:hypothetical protein KQ1_03217 [Bacillus cereus BAG3O-1]|nr:hypothetical protein KQ1_03217 [Bacillus cereus BAG3O-1]SCV20811.1 Uncharacterized protein BCRIVMBC845_03341 [Bacillus cereus]